jgi:soluble lytic murein transglycosylase-like protein
LQSRALAAARHGAAAFSSFLTLAFAALLALVVASGISLDPAAAVRSTIVRVATARLFRPSTEEIETVPVAAAAPPAAAQEAAMGARALLDRWTPYVEEASRRFGLPAAWIRAVMRQESGGRTVMEDGSPITSAAGAQGLMQVMPETYDEARRELGLGGDAYDPHDNVIAGASVLRTLYRKYGFPAMFAAYNDGPGNYEASLRGDRELPKETQDYLASVTAHLAADAPRLHRRRRHGTELARRDTGADGG